MSGKSYLPVLGDRGCPARHRLILPLRCLRGGLSPALPARWALAAPGGGLALFVARRPCLPLPFCPHPPDPLPGGKGETISLFCRGLRPRHPGVKPFTALIDPAIQPSLRRGNLRFDVNPTERLSLEQCRQPRRGGTGGEELRRLRWSSPPGQG